MVKTIINWFDVAILTSTIGFFMLAGIIFVKVHALPDTVKQHKVRVCENWNYDYVNNKATCLRWTTHD